MFPKSQAGDLVGQMTDRVRTPYSCPPVRSGRGELEQAVSDGAALQSGSRELKEGTQ
jgi:hypothetical protein